MTSTAIVSPTLLRPPQNDKVMDTAPSFEWQPQQGVVRYQIEITTTDPTVTATVVYTANTIYTHHTPNVRLAKGTYYTGMYVGWMQGITRWVVGAKRAACSSHFRRVGHA
jgi:hypothetical protein